MAYDIPAFIKRNSKALRFPEIKAAAQTLKSEYPKVGAIGYCYGGWAVFQLGSDPCLVDVVVTAHPSLLEESEIDAVKVPIQILAPEVDQMFTTELKEHSNKVIPTLGVPYKYVHFPGLVHGFSTRGNETDSLQKAGLEKAKNNAVTFLKEYLH
jgi:dienelactone hydrolase